MILALEWQRQTLFLWVQDNPGLYKQVPGQPGLLGENLSQKEKEKENLLTGLVLVIANMTEQRRTWRQTLSGSTPGSGCCSTEEMEDIIKRKRSTMVSLEQ